MIWWVGALLERVVWNVLSPRERNADSASIELNKTGFNFGFLFSRVRSPSSCLVDLFDPCRDNHKRVLAATFFNFTGRWCDDNIYGM